ncbi:peptidoglycan-binding protein [Candidatus Nomurabacteria bacterium]|nr:MAG: peptidoglycan-binding protein [Candidatus Nomurabacteria bacterium]
MSKFTKFAVVAFAFVAVLALAKSTYALVTVPPNLSQGSSGTQVVNLQTALGGLTADGNFGPLTKAAVVSYQSAHGLTADGVVGPMTAASINGMATGSYPAGCTSNTGYSVTTGASCAAATTLPAGCTSTVGFSPTTGVSCAGTTTPTGPLAGSFGDISNVTELGSYSGEEVGEGQDDVTVAGFEVEATNDGDIEISSMKIQFDSTGNTGSLHLDDYIDSISIMMGSTEVGSADVDEFTESSDIYTRTVSLDGAVIRADETENFYIVVNAAGTFDSSDLTGDSWDVDVLNIRFVDGSGVTTTDDSTGDMPGMDVTIDFVSFSDAADTELVVTLDSDSPEAGIALVSDTGSTDDVSLLMGTLEAEGDSDIIIDELPITFTATSSGTANGIDDIATSVKLIIDGEEYTETMTITAALTGTITFDNLDFTLSAGDTVDFEVQADIKEIDGTVFAEGDTLLASLTSTNNDYIDAEDEEGDQLTDDTEKTGTATGEAQQLRSNGIMVTFVSASVGSISDGGSANDDLGSFTIKYKVKAVGETIYVSSLADDTTGANTDGYTSVTVDRAGTATTGGVSAVLANTTNTSVNAAGLFELTNGEENTFEVTVSVQLPTAGAAGLYRAALSGIRWTTTSTDATPSNSYTSNLDSFKTSYGTLN